MATILPNQILASTTPVLDEQGNFRQNWWLFFYNISQQVLGNQNNSAAAFGALLQADLDAEADSADWLTLRQRVEALERSISEDFNGPSIADVFNALQLAQEKDLPDPAPRAQPAKAISVGASPFTYTAPFDGSVVISGGTVSQIQISRDGTTFYTVTNTMIPVRRLDQVKVTYSGLPTMVLL